MRTRFLITNLMKASASRNHQRSRAAFTLIEILVVLSIASIITAITVGGFNEMRNGNKRTSCQANLVQIYQASRLYASDEGGNFPYYNFSSVNNCNTSASGTGLWMLYTFPSSTLGFNEVARVDENKPIERYLRSAKVLHCPSDSDLSHTQLFSSNPNIYNTNYLSYQSCDGGVPTYTSARSTSTSQTRQLPTYNAGVVVSRPPADTTVVTWCIYHRKSRDYDNVLFYDGSVQLMPRDQGGLTGWLRNPKEPQ